MSALLAASFEHQSLATSAWEIAAHIVRDCPTSCAVLRLRPLAGPVWWVALLGEPAIDDGLAVTFRAIVATVGGLVGELPDDVVAATWERRRQYESTGVERVQRGKVYRREEAKPMQPALVPAYA